MALILNRRQFIGRVGAGTAALTMSGSLLRCASTSAAVKPEVPVSAHQTYFDAFGIDQGLLRRLLERGLGKGGDFSEVFLQHRVRHWVGVEDGKVSRAYSTIDLGAGIRVLKGDATGFAYSEDLDPRALMQAAGTAAAVASSGGGVQPASFAPVALASAYTVEVPWTDVGVDRKLPIVARSDEVARAHDQRIIKVTAFLEDDTSHILIANSEGVLVEDEQPMTLLSVQCVAQQGDATETSFQSASARDGIGFFTPEQIARTATEAADYTVRLFDAASAPVGELPVVLAPGVTGILLHESMGHGFEADFNRKGVSIFADLMGKKIAPETVTIVDDGTNPRLRGSINIDDEGVAGQRTVLVDKGKLSSFLHDRISSRHYRVPSTGNGRRESFRFPPVPRMRNTYMLDGPHSPEEIIASVERGIYAENFANGQVNIGAGDFTFYLKHGRLIEKGKLTAVVKDANLIGAGPTVLEKIDMVGNDMALFSGGGYCGKDGQRIPVGFGLPTVRTSGISIGGRKA